MEEQKGSAPINAIKVTLSGGKVVMLREMKMKYQNLALQAVGSKAKGNDMLAGALMLQELMKILIVNVDGVVVKSSALEALDDMFSYQQIQQLQKVIGKMMGGEEDSSGEALTEFVSIGN